jgi:hypothetical protein
MERTKNLKHFGELYMDKNLIDIQEELKKTIRKLSDAEWEGREGEVKTLTALEKHYRLLIKQGELYEPRF